MKVLGVSLQKGHFWAKVSHALHMIACVACYYANAEQITHQLAIIAFFLLLSLSLLGCL